MEDLEQKCGAKPDKEHYGLVSRLEVLQHKLGVDTIKSSDLIEVRLGKLEKAYNLKQEVQNERNDNMKKVNGVENIKFGPIGNTILGPKPEEYESIHPDDEPPFYPVDDNSEKLGMLGKIHKFVVSQKPISVDTRNILECLPYILQLQAQKAAVYGRSYCRHGELSIFLNTERKWDRIANIMDKAMKEGTEYLYSPEAGTATETFLDTVVDLASYSLLWLGYIKETHPKAFQKFVKSNNLEV